MIENWKNKQCETATYIVTTMIILSDTQKYKHDMPENNHKMPPRT